MPVATTSGAADAQPGLVSVIVPTFDRAAMVQELLRSLEEQDWPSLEVIVVDDGSRDGTFAALERWIARSSLDMRLVRQGNCGPAAARNRGLAAASGEFVYFIDSDDLVLPTGLSRLVAELQRSGASYCVACVDNLDRRRRGPAARARAYRRIDRRGIVGSAWPTHAALYRKSALERAGGYDERLRRGEDEELHWRLMSACGPGRMIDDVVALRRIHAEGRLSDDMSPAGMGRCRYDEISCFTGWASSRGALRPDVAASCLAVLSVAILRLRVGDDQATCRAAVKLGRELAASGAGPTLFFRFCSACRSRAVLWICLHALEAARDVRYAASSIAGQLKAVSRGMARKLPEPPVSRIEPSGRRIAAGPLPRSSR